MGQKLVVGALNQGLRNDLRPFYIDNDSFPVLANAYQWRGRVKRKRGTQTFTRLTRYFDSTSVSYIPASKSTITLDANGQANMTLYWGFANTATYYPTSIVLTSTVTSVVYTDTNGNGILYSNAAPPVNSGTINYGSGEITIASEEGNTLQAQFRYYPGLPVMGLEDFITTSTQYPSVVGFDKTYAYLIPTTRPSLSYSVSFYKNPSTSGSYTQKTHPTPVNWNGNSYQQFWTVNYQGAMWTTNGFDVPFTGSVTGMQFSKAADITSVTYGSATTITMTVANCPAVIGDFIFLNEFTASNTATNANTLNFQTGYVTSCSPNTPSLASKTITITLPNATLASDTYLPGIIQYLTNTRFSGVDCLRWFDGDPTDQVPSDPILNGTKGWVNFMPPINMLPETIDDLLPAQYYLVGAKIIQNFKDRIIFFGPVIQSSTSGPFYLPDTIVYSQDGTPYYTASFACANTQTVLNANLVFNPILTPANQTATPTSYFYDVSGYGGWLAVGIDQAINTLGANEDVLLVGLDRTQTRLIYSGNDLVPFVFYLVNSELGSSSTFSAIVMDKAVLTKGNRGFVATSQVGTERIDPTIPDEVFEVDLLNNGSERVTAQRDFINEWIYFTYPDDTNPNIFPTKTLQYNYRDNSWAIFYESYTTYGTIRITTGLTWATVGSVYPTWSVWDEPWNSGSSNALQPKVIGGNQQGFVMLRDVGTSEGTSLFLQNVSSPTAITGATQATDCVLTCSGGFIAGQQITITDVAGMTQLNGNTYTVISSTATTVTINVNSSGFGMYTSGGLATPVEPYYVPNNCLSEGDYITFQGALGTIGPYINGVVFSVYQATSIPTLNGFGIYNPDVYIPSGLTYLGGGTIIRYYVPFIQTKQFPSAWAGALKTRIGPQQYLFTKTDAGQVTLYIYLSQSATYAYNQGPIVPDPNSQNNSLVYSTVVYTCPEDYIQVCPNIPLGNVGNGSSTSYSFNYFILFNIKNTTLVPGSVFVSVGSLATFQDNSQGGFTVTGTGDATGSSVDYYGGNITLAFTSAPTSQKTTTNFSYYVENIQSPTASSQSEIWHRLSTSLVGDTVQLAVTLSDAQMRDPNLILQTDEIELHGFIMDLNPSSLLA